MLGSFDALPTWGLAGAFLLASAAVWRAGTQLARVAEAIARRVGLERAFTGMVLLGMSTSLPEIATVSTAALSGAPQLATSNLLGGVAFQTALLVGADALYGRRALAASPPKPEVLLQGVLLVVMLGVVVVALMAPQAPAWHGVSASTAFLLACFVGATWFLQRLPAQWRPERLYEAPEGGHAQFVPRELPLARLAGRFALAAALVLVAGYVLARSADVLAQRSGIGQSFVGAVLLAAATSLPEASTTTEAVRIGAPDLAISNVLGTNLADVALLAVADAFYRPGPILAEAGAFSVAATGLGIVLTGLYLVGLLERRDRTFLRLGIGSWGVLVAYVGGLALLYAIRPA